MINPWSFQSLITHHQPMLHCCNLERASSLTPSERIRHNLLMQKTTSFINDRLPRIERVWLSWLDKVGSGPWDSSMMFKALDVM
ncbi:hypothetical protein FKM82_008658 [Ascaphus truei]